MGAHAARVLVRHEDCPACGCRHRFRLPLIDPIAREYEYVCPATGRRPSPVGAVGGAQVPANGRGDPSADRHRLDLHPVARSHLVPPAGPGSRPCHQSGTSSRREVAAPDVTAYLSRTGTPFRRDASAANPSGDTRWIRSALTGEV